MVIYALMYVVLLVVMAVFSAIGVILPSPPGFVTSAFGSVGVFFGYAQSFSNWLPVTVGIEMASAVLGVKLASWAIGLAFKMLSYFTFGGGAT